MINGLDNEEVSVNGIVEPAPAASTSKKASRASLLTVSQVAQRLHMSPSTVRRRIDAGEIPAQRQGDERLVDAQQLEVVLTERRAVFRKTKPKDLAQQSPETTDIEVACFDLFNSGMEPNLVVVKVRAPSALVEQLYQRWNRMRDDSQKRREKDADAKRQNAPVRITKPAPAKPALPAAPPKKDARVPGSDAWHLNLWEYDLRMGLDLDTDDDGAVDDLSRKFGCDEASARELIRAWRTLHADVKPKQPDAPSGG